MSSNKTKNVSAGETKSVRGSKRFVSKPEIYNEAPAPRQGKWTAEEDELLHQAIQRHGEKQWRRIAEDIPGRSPIQCLHRWTKILKPGLVKGPWTQEEDEKLVQWVAKEGATKWANAGTFINGRSGKQCRERWFNNLNPALNKGPWSQEEDELIYSLFQTHGSCWSVIAKSLPGRTENSIKNRFYSTLRKLATSKRKTTPADGTPVINVTPAEAIVPPPDENGTNHLFMRLAEEKIEIKQAILDPAAIEAAKERRRRRNKKKQAMKAIEHRNKLQKQNAVHKVLVDAPEISKPTKVEDELASQTETEATSGARQQSINGSLEVQPKINIMPMMQHERPNLDQKMGILLDKLGALEAMLTNTRQELLRLETSMTDEEKRSLKLTPLLESYHPRPSPKQFGGAFPPFPMEKRGKPPMKISLMDDIHDEPRKMMRFNDNELLNQDDMNNSEMFDLCDEILGSFH